MYLDQKLYIVSNLIIEQTYNRKYKQDAFLPPYSVVSAHAHAAAVNIKSEEESCGAHPRLQQS